MKPYELPKKVANLTPYVPLEGDFALRLDANESFLHTPDWLREEMMERLATVDFRRYPDPSCTGVRQGFSSFFKVPVENVVAGNGSDELIGLLVSWFLTEQDLLAVVPPDFTMYSFYAQMVGAKVISFEKDMARLGFDPAELVKFVQQEKPAMLILSNPCNPTSTSASRQDIVTLLENLDCLVVIDEAYMEFAADSVMDLTTQYSNLVVLKTCSKAFGMAGIRLGFAVASEQVAEALRRAKSPFNVNSMTQLVGETVFAYPDYLLSCTAIIKASRDSLYQGLQELSWDTDEILQVVPTLANFVLLRMQDGRAVYQALLQEGVAIRCFGEFLRITAGSPTENEALLAALRKVLHC